jgi:MFS family permease
MIVVGLPGALTMAGAMTLIQRDTAGSHRGRVFGALGAVEGIAIVAGTVAAGFLGQAVGIIPVLAVQGGGYVAAGLLVVVALRHEAPGRQRRKADPPVRQSGPQVAQPGSQPRQPAR